MKNQYTSMIACMALLNSHFLVQAAQENSVRGMKRQRATERDIKNDRNNNLLAQHIQMMLQQNRLCRRLNHRSPLYKLPDSLMYSILQYVGNQWSIKKSISYENIWKSYNNPIYDMQKLNETTLIMRIGGVYDKRYLYTFNIANQEQQSFLCNRAAICTFAVIAPDTSLVLGINDRITLYHHNSSNEIPLTPGQHVRTIIPLSQNVCALGKKNGTIDLWDIVDDKHIKTLKNPTDTPTAQVQHGASLGNELLAIVYHRMLERIYIWNTHNDSIKCCLDEHTHGINTLAPITPTLLASGSDDASIKLWDIEQATCTRTYSEAGSSHVRALLALDNNTFAAGYNHSLIKVFDQRCQTCIAKLSGHTRSVNGLITLNNKSFASCSEDSTVKIWNMRYDIAY